MFGQNPSIWSDISCHWCNVRGGRARGRPPISTFRDNQQEKRIAAQSGMAAGEDLI